MIKCLRILSQRLFIKLQFVGSSVRGKGILFILSLGPDGGVIFLFSAKRPLRKVELSSYSRRAGQRRCFQRICLVAFYRGRPSLRSGSRSLQKNHSPVRPKLRPILLPRTRCSRYKNIDVLAACHYENAVLYGHRLGRRW